MLSDIVQLGPSFRGYAIVSMIIDDIFEEIIDLIKLAAVLVWIKRMFRKKEYLAPVPIIGVP